MAIKYDASQQCFLPCRSSENKNLVIGLDVAKGKDKCVEMVVRIRNKDKISTVETLKTKE